MCHYPACPNSGWLGGRSAPEKAKPSERHVACRVTSRSLEVAAARQQNKSTLTLATRSGAHAPRCLDGVDRGGTLRKPHADYDRTARSLFSRPAATKGRQRPLSRHHRSVRRGQLLTHIKRCWSKAYFVQLLPSDAEPRALGRVGCPGEP